MKNNKTKKMHYALTICLVMSMSILSCFLLPQEELDYYANYYNMTVQEQPGSSCRLYIGSIPEIRWKNYSGFTGYQLQVSQDKEFSTLLVNEENLTTAYYMLSTPLKTAGDYYYRLKYKTPDNTWSKWSEPVKLTLSPDTLQDDFEALPDSETALIPWVMEGNVKLNTSYYKTGKNSLDLTTNSKKKTASLALEIYCASATGFTFWYYDYFSYDSDISFIIDETTYIPSDYSWTVFDSSLSPGYHSIIIINNFPNNNYSYSDNRFLLDNLQFTNYEEKLNTLFSGLGTNLTSYEFTGGSLFTLKEETGISEYLEMGQGNNSSSTTLTLKMNCAVACEFYFSYRVNYYYTYGGTFSVSCNTVYYFTSNWVYSWLSVQLSLVAGENTIIIRYDKNSIHSEVADIKDFIIKVKLDGFESGTLNNLPWSTSGTLPVIIQNTYNYEGSNAVRIGNSTASATGNGSLQLSLTVAEAAEFSFHFMVNSYISDQLIFSIDGVQIKKWNYETTSTWHPFIYRLSPGSHILKWTMNDNSNTTAYYAYIDNLYISTTNYTIP